MQLDIPGALHDLSRIVDRLAELVEWHKLAIQPHNPRLPPSFQARDDISEDIRSMYGWFLDMKSQIRQALHVSSITAAEVQWSEWLQQLEHMEQRVNTLNITDRFINF